MKYKIKDLQFEKISFSKVQIENGTLLNLKYNNDSLEFQTPRVIIDSLIKENDHEYLILKIIGNEACKKFCSKITQLELFFSDYLKNEIKPIFNEDCFTVKVPFKYSRPLVKVYKNEKMFNYYHLSESMEIICLLSLDKVWISNVNEPNYNLTVKEILVTN
jgi:hypothetical protein